MIIDSNLLIYAVDESSPFHDAAKTWLQETLNGPLRVGFPWQSTTGFLRIATNPRAVSEPMSPPQAWRHVEEWLGAPNAWIPEPGPGYGEILGGLISELHLAANLIPDAALAALCVEHGLAMVSADSDFARFPQIRWINPLQPAAPR